MSALDFSYACLENKIPSREKQCFHFYSGNVSYSVKTWIFFSFLWYGPIKSQSRRTPVSLFAWWKFFFCESEDCLLSKKGSREVVTSRHMRPCFILFGIIAFHSHARHNRHFIGDIQEIQQVFPIFMWHFMFMWNFKCNSSNVNIDFWYCKKLAWNIDFG